MILRLSNAVLLHQERRAIFQRAGEKDLRFLKRDLLIEQRVFEAWVFDCDRQSRPVDTDALRLYDLSRALLANLRSSRVYTTSYRSGKPQMLLGWAREAGRTRD